MLTADERRWLLASLKLFFNFKVTLRISMIAHSKSDITKHSRLDEELAANAAVQTDYCNDCECLCILQSKGYHVHSSSHGLFTQYPKNLKLQGIWVSMKHLRD